MLFQPIVFYGGAGTGDYVSIQRLALKLLVEPSSRFHLCCALHQLLPFKMQLGIRYSVII